MVAGSRWAVRIGMVCIWDVESGGVLYKVCPCVVISVASTYAYVASWAQGDRDVGRFPSKRAHQCVSPFLSFFLGHANRCSRVVLTGSFNG